MRQLKTMGKTIQGHTEPFGAKPDFKELNITLHEYARPLKTMQGPTKQFKTVQYNKQGLHMEDFAGLYRSIKGRARPTGAYRSIQEHTSWCKSILVHKRAYRTIDDSIRAHKNTQKYTYLGVSQSVTY